MEDDTTDVSCDEKDLVEQVLEYLRTNSYVDDCTEATKRTIRRKAKKFKLPFSTECSSTSKRKKEK